MKVLEGIYFCEKCKKEKEVLESVKDYRIIQCCGKEMILKCVYPPGHKEGNERKCEMIYD